MWLAALWGLFAGAALLLGAGVVMLAHVGTRTIGAVMGFGAGVLFAAVAFELTTEAIAEAGLAVSVVMLLVGAGVYLAGDWAVSVAGAHRRKSPLHGGASVDTHQELSAERATPCTPPTDDAGAPVPQGAPGPEGMPGTEGMPVPEGMPGPQGTSVPKGGTAPAAALVLGALLDGVPESAAIGISLLDGRGVGLAFVVAVFLSNVPEGMAASAGLVASGRSRVAILGLWSGLAVVSAAAAGLGYSVLGAAGSTMLGSIQAFAAGAVLAMLATTMVPEAVDHAGRLVGLVTVLGFAAAVLLSAV